MTLFAYQIFHAVAQQGSFARAAELLHVTPSAISHAVATMEAECGFPLFTRTKNGVTMTADAIMGDSHNTCIVYTISLDNSAVTLSNR